MELKYIILLLLNIHYGQASSFNYSMRIGSILDDHDSVLSTGLQNTVSSINNSTSLLVSTRLDLHSVFMDARDVMSSFQSVCSQLEHSVVTMLVSGPAYPFDTQSTQVTKMLNIWHLPHFSSNIPTKQDIARNPYTIHLGPTKESLLDGLFSIIQRLRENNPDFDQEDEAIIGLVTHQSRMFDSSIIVAELQRINFRVIVENLEGKNVKPNLVRLRDSGAKIILVDFDSELILAFLSQALQASLLQPHLTLLFTTLDFPPLSQLSAFSYTGVTMISYSLLPPNQTLPKGVDTRDHRAVILHDSLVLFSSTISSLPLVPEAQRLNCSDPDSVFNQGSTIVKSIQNHNLDGKNTLTGAISFTTDKMRTNINLYLMVRIGENTNLGGIYSTETAELTIQPGFLSSSLTDPNHDSVTLKNMVKLDSLYVDAIISLLNDNGIIVSDKLEEDLVDFSGRCSILICNQEQLNILPRGKTFVNKIEFLIMDTDRYLCYIIPFIFGFLLVMLTLTLISYLLIYKSKKVSLADSFWIVSTATFLNIQHNKLKSAASRVLILGWIIFSMSLLVSFILESIGEQFKILDDVFLVGNRRCKEVQNISDFKLTVNENEIDLPIKSIAILAATLGATLLSCLLEISILKKTKKPSSVRDSQDDTIDSQDNDHDTVGSDQKLLPWSEKQLERSYSNHSV